MIIYPCQSKETYSLLDLELSKPVPGLILLPYTTIRLAFVRS